MKHGLSCSSCRVPTRGLCLAKLNARDVWRPPIPVLHGPKQLQAIETRNTKIDSAASTMAQRSPSGCHLQLHPHLNRTCPTCIVEHGNGTCNSCIARGFDCSCNCLSTTKRNHRIGVVGGSISTWSTTPGDVYPRLLEKITDVHVTNKAERATGVISASLWLDQMLNVAEIDVLVIEFSCNEAVTWAPPQQQQHHNGQERILVPHSVVDLPHFGPRASMERLLRRLHPGIVPVVLNICGPGPGGRKSSRLRACDKIFEPVAKHYGVQTLTLNDHLPSLMHRWSAFVDDTSGTSTHLNHYGHSIVALMLGEALQAGLRTPTRPLPPAVFQDAKWEAIDQPWHCSRASLLVAYSVGFHPRPLGTPPLAGSSFAPAGLPQAARSSKHERPTIVFRLPSRSDHPHASDGTTRRALVALQCSLESSKALLTADGTRFVLEPRWRHPAGHMCFADVGRIPRNSTLKLELLDNSEDKRFVLEGVCSQ